MPAGSFTGRIGREGADSLASYLSRIGRIKLLTKEEEGALSEAIAKGRAAAAELEAGVDDLVRQAHLERAVRSADLARERFVAANLRLVVAIAKRFRQSGVAFEDLLQEGNLGLLHAVEKFDWRRGFRFSTYASWWIRQALSRGALVDGAPVRLPADAALRVRTVRRTVFDLQQERGRAPTAAELSDATGLDERRILEALSVPLETASFQDGAANPRDRTWEEILGDELAPTPFDVVAESVRRDELASLLDLLDERERALVRLRFGLDGADPMSFDEAAVHVGVTRERARQIVAGALDKLRHPSTQRARRRQLVDL